MFREHHLPLAKGSGDVAFNARPVIDKNYVFEENFEQVQMQTLKLFHIFNNP
jgi:hypothetical protein